MDAEKIILGLLLSVFPLSILNGSDFYLSRIGPAPLRFAAAPSTKEFHWPALVKPTPHQTNDVTVSDSSRVANTNSILSSTSPDPKTSTPVSVPAEMAVTNPPILPQIPPSTEGNLLSASNLLILTPQMLADYFKANLDSLTRLATNGFSGADIPFNPPTPKAPSSEATYKTQ